jgi:O-antigen/teichoic acid export membrane protein
MQRARGAPPGLGTAGAEIDPTQAATRQHRFLGDRRDVCRRIRDGRGILKYLNAAKEAALVVTGQVGVVAITAMTAKILTTQLGAEDYGRVALATTTQLLFAQVIFTPLASGVARYLMPLSRVGRARELHIVLDRTLGRLLGGFALLAAIAGTITGARWDLSLGLLVSGGIIYGASQGAAAIFQTFETAARRRGRAAFLQTLPLAARLVVSVLLIVLTGARSQVIVMGMALATSAVLLPQVLRLRLRAARASAAGVVPSAELSGAMWRIARHFSIWGGFYAAQLVSDVWALKLVAGDRLVGTYAVAVLISSGLVLLANIVSQLIHPVVYERSGLGIASAEARATSPLVRLGVLAMLIVTLFATVGSVVFGDSIVLLLSNREYLGAAEVLPMIMVGVGLRETGHIASVSFFARNDTREFLIIRVFVSVVAILANLIGAASGGMAGVATASAASGALYLAALIWAEQRQTQLARR